MRILKLFIVAIMLCPLLASSKNADFVNSKISSEIKSKFAPDSRQAIWTVKAIDAPNVVILKGNTSEHKAHKAFITELNKYKIAYKDSITVYPNDKWGIVRISVAHLRGKASHSGEIVSQAIMGTPLRLLEKVGDWWRVQSPDGYIAYMIGNSMVIKSDDEMGNWRSSKRLVVTSFDQIKTFDNTDNRSNKNIVTDLVNGCIVEGQIDSLSSVVKIILPDGRNAWSDASNFMPIEEWSTQDFNPEKIIELGYSMMGVPYLWGGMSTKSLDCSGFARVCYFANGYILMRDASQQALTGMYIDAKNWMSCKTGDLLFFGNAKTRKVTHVAIYENDGWYLHSSGRVKRNSVDPQSEGYLTTPFLHAVRIVGFEGTEGIVKVCNHKWYFNID